MIGKIILFIYLLTIITNIWLTYNMKRRIDSLIENPEDFSYKVSILVGFIPLYNIIQIMGKYLMCTCDEELLRTMMKSRRDEF